VGPWKGANGTTTGDPFGAAPPPPVLPVGTATGTGTTFPPAFAGAVGTPLAATPNATF
jgi:hypothetical protein